MVFDLVLGVQLILGQWGYITLPYQHVRIAIVEAMCIGIVLYYLIQMIWKTSPLHIPYTLWRTITRLHTTHTWVLYYSAYVFIRSIFFISLDSNGIISVLYAWRSLIPLILLEMSNQNSTNSTQHIHITKIIIWIVVGLCLMQYVFVPDMRFLTHWGWDPHMYRAIGTLLDPPVVGSVLIIFLVYNLVIQSTLSTIATYITIIFLYSRGTYVALLVVVSLFYAYQKKWFSVSLFMIVTYGCIHFAPLTIRIAGELESAKIFRTSTVYTRTDDIALGLRTIGVNPLFGLGQGAIPLFKNREIVQYETGNHAAHAFHNTYITHIVSVGILGTWLYACALWSYLRNVPALYLAICGIGLIGLIDNSMLHPLVLSAYILVYRKSNYMYKKK